MDENAKRAIASIIVVWIMTVMLVCMAYHMHKSEQINEATTVGYVATEEVTS